MKLLLLGLGWLVLTCLVRGAGNLALAKGSIMNGVFAFLLCYPLGMALSQGGVKRFLRLFIALWTGCFTVFSLMALWAAVNGAEIVGFAGTTHIGVDAGYSRLSLFGYYTDSAAVLGLSALLCLIGAALTRRWPGRILYLAAMAPMLMALSLTDGRTGFVSVAAGLGLAGSALLAERLQKRGMKVGLRAACGAAVLAVIMAAVVLLLPLCMQAISSVSRTGGPVVQLAMADNTALAEEAAADATEAPADTGLAEHRSYLGADALTGRPDVWKAALQLIANKPWLLISGTSIPMVMGYVNEYVESDYTYFGHLHCVYLQVLVETGVVGFLIMLAFLLLAALRSWRLLLEAEVPLWQRLLPIVPFAVLVGELVEGLTLLRVGGPSLTLLMLFCGLIARFGRRAQ